jgi:hypothetical protein
MHPERREMKVKINKGREVAQSINRKTTTLRESAETSADGRYVRVAMLLICYYRQVFYSADAVTLC